METSTVLERLRQVFANTFQIEPPSAEVDLVDNGILDSFQLVELLFQLEREFGLRIALEQLDLDDLRSLERIARVITADDRAAKQGGATDKSSAAPAS
jgi:acyl carrier protein